MFKKRTFLVVPGYQRFEEMREHVSSFSVTFTYAVSTSFSVQITIFQYYCILKNALNCIVGTKNRVELNIISLQRKIFNINKLKSYTELSGLHLIIEVYCHLQPCFDKAAKLFPSINLGHVVALITVDGTLFVNKGLLLG